MVSFSASTDAYKIIPCYRLPPRDQPAPEDNTSEGPARIPRLLTYRTPIMPQTERYAAMDPPCRVSLPRFGSTPLSRAGLTNFICKNLFSENGCSRNLRADRVVDEIVFRHVKDFLGILKKPHNHDECNWRVKI